VRGAGGAVGLAVLIAMALSACSGSGGGNDTATRASATVVTQNILHGIACASDSDRCKLPKRVELFARQLSEADCPQVVAVEEADPVIVGLLRDQADGICGGYEVVGGDDPSLDREVILTTLPVLGEARTRLAGPLRTALWVRVKAPVGPLDVVATHLASGSDDRPCDSESCPPPCHASDTLNTCQGRQVADILDSHRTDRSVGVLVGDLNAKPKEPTISAILERDYVDTFLAAGNQECDASTGDGCTSGRVDTDLSDLTNPASHQIERIDYVFLATKRDCRVDRPTGLFAAKPATPPLDGLVFASDHTGVQATISCLTSTADLAAARPVGGSSSSTTTTAAAAVDPATAAAVTKAFETVFNGGGSSVETRLTALQDAGLLRDAFIARYEQPAVKAIADQIHVRIDSMSAVDRDHVDVVYSILLDQTAVLDHLPGQAVREAGTWLVSRRSYCQVATLGEATVPEACR
jgi:endonuclease/exonuclease/phosphatase family metal-dependent hydrolase